MGYHLLAQSSHCLKRLCKVCNFAGFSTMQKYSFRLVFEKRNENHIDAYCFLALSKNFPMSKECMEWTRIEYQHRPKYAFVQHEEASNGIYSLVNFHFCKDLDRICRIAPRSLAQKNVHESYDPAHHRNYQEIILESVGSDWLECSHLADQHPVKDCGGQNAVLFQGSTYVLHIRQQAHDKHHNKEEFPSFCIRERRDGETLLRQQDRHEYFRIELFPYNSSARSQIWPDLASGYVKEPDSLSSQVHISPCPPEIQRENSWMHRKLKGQTKSLPRKGTLQ